MNERTSRSFLTLFQMATTDQTPYAYQCRLACGERGKDESDVDWLPHTARTAPAASSASPPAAGDTAPGHQLSSCWSSASSKGCITPLALSNS